MLSANEAWRTRLHKDIRSRPYIRSMFVVLGGQPESPRVLAQSLLVLFRYLTVLAVCHLVSRSTLSFEGNKYA